MKKAMSPELLVGIIALLAVFVVMLTIVFPPFKNALFGAGETSQCQFSILLSVMTKEMTLGFGEIPAECKMKRLTITKKHMEQYQNLAKKSTDRYYKQNIPAQYDFPQTKEGRNNWAASKIIADEMVDCHNKGWRGSFDLKGYWKTLTDAPGAYVCILCTRILVDEEAQQMLHNKIIWMKPWLDANNKEGKTYYALLTEELDPFYVGGIEYASFDATRPQAVVFVAGTKKASGEFGTDAVGGVGIHDYEKLTTDLGFYEIKGLDYSGLPVIGSWYKSAQEFIGELKMGDVTVSIGKITYQQPARCAVIIGD